MKPQVVKHLARAEELLQVAGENLANNHPADSISRSYYAMFHAATGVLAELGIERSSHHGVWAAFGQFVTARRLIDVRHHREGIDALLAREDSDYEAMPDDTREDAEDSLATAREFVDACRAFLEAQV